MSELPPLIYLAGYGPAVEAQVRTLITQGRLGEYLADRYPERHDVRTDKALMETAQELKNRFLRSSPPLHKVRYDPRLQVLRDALGMHTRTSRVHGIRLKAGREIHVDTVFKEAPAAFLRMILVHELAHLKEGEHSKAFYQLCTHMERDYFQLEFDLRLYLTHRDLAKEP
ncbi:MAG TPA: YgjP-like metallopeptidase domain-containing protein [Holophagaceae bacterium]|nr:YgjP-like metallopeptidase domain-containing protein [Holophagaceae bacterium]